MATTNVAQLTDLTTGLVVFEITPNTPVFSYSSSSQSGTYGNVQNNNSTQSISVSLTDPMNQGDRILFLMVSHPYGTAGSSSYDHGLQVPPTYGGTNMNEFISGQVGDTDAVNNGFGGNDATMNGNESGGFHNASHGSQWSLWYLKNPSMTANQSIEVRSRYHQYNSQYNYGKFGYVLLTGIDQTNTFVDMKKEWDSTAGQMQMKKYHELQYHQAQNGSYWRDGTLDGVNPDGPVAAAPGNLMCMIWDANSRQHSGTTIHTPSSEATAAAENKSIYDYVKSDSLGHKYYKDFDSYYSTSYGNHDGEGNTSIAFMTKLAHVSPTEHFGGVNPSGSSTGHPYSYPIVFQLKTSDPDVLMTVPDGYTARVHDLYVTSIDWDGFQADLQVSGLAATGQSPATLLNSSGGSTMTIGTGNVTTIEDGYIFRGKKLHLNQFVDGRIKLLPDGKNLWLAAGDQLKMKMYHENRAREYMHYKARVNMQVEMIKST